MRNSAVRKNSPLQEEGEGLHLKGKKQNKNKTNKQKKQKERDHYYYHDDIREDADSNGSSPVQDCFSIMMERGL